MSGLHQLVCLILFRPRQADTEIDGAPWPAINDWLANFKMASREESLYKSRPYNQTAG